eukprot:g927.t1
MSAGSRQAKAEAKTVEPVGRDDIVAAGRRRLDTLRQHLTGASTAEDARGGVQSVLDDVQRKAWQGVDPLKVDINEPGTLLPPVVRGKILHFFDQIADKRSIDGHDVSQHLPGPSPHDIGKGKRYGDIKEFLRDMSRADNDGSNHTMWHEMQKRYCASEPDPSLANICIPVISFSRRNERPPILTNKIILSHPDDCERIARTHVKKMPDQAIFLGPGVLSQVHVERWREQRAHLSEAFMPLGCLQHVMPISTSRAEKANGTLRELLRASPDGVVQMNEFLLNETMAQLMLAMFGLPDDIVEKHNVRTRKAFSYLLEKTGGTGGGAAEDIDQVQVAKQGKAIFSFVSDFMACASEMTGVREAMESCAAIKGPLTARIWDIDEGFPERVFNAATFLFAGHDTTANTMTWFLYEIAKQPKIQQQLQKEVDAMFAKIGDREMRYDDLHELPFMTRCLMETLRLWPVVPNGTFRELQFDDVIKGPGGKEVIVKKGTYCQIVNWMRHRSPSLWGRDAASFNPNREWQENEVWGGSAFAAYNPHSKRFSPFTYTPRDCIGKNFAQMEMRVILAKLIRDFHFELGRSARNIDPSTYLGVNRATLGPRDTEIDQSLPAQLGMYFQVTER